MNEKCNFNITSVKTKFDSYHLLLYICKSRSEACGINSIRIGSFHSFSRLSLEKERKRERKIVSRKLGAISNR